MSTPSLFLSHPLSSPRKDAQDPAADHAAKAFDDAIMDSLDILADHAVELFHSQDVLSDLKNPTRDDVW